MGLLRGVKICLASAYCHIRHITGNYYSRHRKVLILVVVRVRVLALVLVLVPPPVLALVLVLVLVPVPVLVSCVRTLGLEFCLRSYGVFASGEATSALAVASGEASMVPICPSLVYGLNSALSASLCFFSCATMVKASSAYLTWRVQYMCDKCGHSESHTFGTLGSDIELASIPEPSLEVIDRRISAPTHCGGQLMDINLTYLDSVVPSFHDDLPLESLAARAGPPAECSAGDPEGLGPGSLPAGAGAVPGAGLLGGADAAGRDVTRDGLADRRFGLSCLCRHGSDQSDGGHGVDSDGTHGSDQGDGACAWPGHRLSVQEYGWCRVCRRGVDGTHGSDHHADEGHGHGV